MATANELDGAIERYHHALDAFSRGDPEPVKALYSHRDDVALANPLGPTERGWEQVAAALDYASSRFRDGAVTSFEPLARYEAAQLATLLELERWWARVGDRAAEVTPFEMRVTSTFRHEDGAWRLVHRHADFTTPHPEGPLRGA